MNSKSLAHCSVATQVGVHPFVSSTVWSNLNVRCVSTIPKGGEKVGVGSA